jgi:hypothetical protein
MFQNRLVVFELTTGFPHAARPDFAARRTATAWRALYKQVLERDQRPTTPAGAGTCVAILSN